MCVYRWTTSDKARTAWLINWYLQVSDGKAAYKLRAAALAAGFPNTAGASTVNRFCSSGLKATADIAHAIANGSIEIGVAVGAESMSVGGDRLEKPIDVGVTGLSQEAAD
jgi:acetyl-CoA acyltransferase 1